MMTYKDLERKRDEMLLYVNADEDDWMAKNLYKLYDMALEARQLDVPTEITPCRRVISIKRVLPVDVLRLNHPEIIVFEGVFATVNGIAIPNKIAEQLLYKKSGRKVMINVDELPEGYDYGTVQNVGRYYFALSKEDALNNYLTNTSGWRLFDLNLNY